MNFKHILSRLKSQLACACIISVFLAATTFTATAAMDEITLDLPEDPNLSQEIIAPASEPVAKELIPLGHTVGVKLFSAGLIVVGSSELKSDGTSASPAFESGITEGDILTQINSTRLDSIETLQNILKNSSGEALSISYTRAGKPLQATVTPIKSEKDSYKLGVWLRDSMAGIGTMTFFDPKSNVFGALGHGINDVDTMQLMPLSSGAIVQSTVAGVKKGRSGSPGELQGDFTASTIIGSLYANSDTGIFGKLTETGLAEGKTAIPIARFDEITVGPATILSNVEGDLTETFNIQITRVYPDKNDTTRNMTIEVTDPRLLEITGGIVQGMSGSPIIQNGKLVGAVTHVLVNDPVKGYGVSIENMLSMAFYNEKTETISFAKAS